jgi:hypothetical protein
MGPFLSGDWYTPEEWHRWMAKQAGVRMAGPRTAGQSLYVSGALPPEFFADGPIVLTAMVEGKPLRPVQLRQTEVDVSFPLPPEAVGRQAVEVTLQVDRTHTPPQDGRQLGIAIHSVEIR